MPTGMPAGMPAGMRSRIPARTRALTGEASGSVSRPLCATRCCRGRGPGNRTTATGRQPMPGDAARRTLKRRLARLARFAGDHAAPGATLLIYHRVGGGSPDERDLTVADFAAQLDALPPERVVSLDSAMDRLDRGERSPGVVLTFDDGFADMHEHAWPLLRDRGLP